MTTDPLTQAAEAVEQAEAALRAACAATNRCPCRAHTIAEVEAHIAVYDAEQAALAAIEKGA
jgi:hypothetical protein